MRPFISLTSTRDSICIELEPGFTHTSVSQTVVVRKMGQYAEMFTLSI